MRRASKGILHTRPKGQARVTIGYIVYESEYMIYSVLFVIINGILSLPAPYFASAVEYAKCIWLDEYGIYDNTMKSLSENNE